MGVGGRSPGRKRPGWLHDTGDLIRANQGHSVEVDHQLEEKQPPEFLYHGTVERFIASIMVEGLKNGKRHHVHLSNDVETARKVGSRRGKPVILGMPCAQSPPQFSVHLDHNPNQDCTLVTLS